MGGENLPGRTLQLRRRHHKRSLSYGLCRIDQVRSHRVHTWITCIGDETHLLLKITSFLVSHNAQHKAAAPTRICAENCLSIPLNQLPNMLRALRGGYKFEATRTMAQTAQANLHSKNKCLIDSSCWQKTRLGALPVATCQIISS